MATDNPPEGGINITVGGGGGGSSSGGSSSGGGGGGTDPRAAYRSVLAELRLPVGMFADLISRAAAERWTSSEFVEALSNTAAFNRLFPGAQSLLDAGMSVPQAIQSWRKTAAAYEQSLRDVGLWGIMRAKMTPQNIGLAISMGIDPDELVFRAGIYEQAMRSESFREAFNAVLKGQGQAQLDKGGWMKFLLGKGDSKLYDTYEGTVLYQELGAAGLSARQARQLGRGIGVPGQPADLSAVMDSVNRIRSTLGSQQLADAGISAFDLAAAALGEQVTSPKIKARAAQATASLEQMFANRQATEKATGGEVTSLTAGLPIASSAPTGQSAG